MEHLQFSLLCSSWLNTLMLLWMLLLVHLVLQQPNGCFACVEQERIALLDIELAFTGHVSIADPSSFFSLWNKSIECCSWLGVHCSPTSKHVRGLDLVGITWENMMFNSNTLNISLFLPFRELRNLNLYGNHFNSCCIPSDCFGRLAKLDINLKFLDLSWNNFDSKALSSLATLRSLKALSLKQFWIEGSFPDDKQSQMQSELFINTLSGALSKLSKLKYLDLSENYLNGSIIPYLGQISSLKTLDLSWNKMDEGFDLNGLCKIKNLEELDISYNSMNANIPFCIRNMSSLNYFDASYNQFEMNFPSSIFENLTRLEFLDFSNNNFKGVFSFSSFANNTELKFLDLSNNCRLEIETEDLINPLFQLKVIDLANCIVNKASHSFPTLFSTQYMVQYIDLSSNKLEGNVPLWLFVNKTNLINLTLRNNSLGGSLIIPSQSTKLVRLDVSNNKLTGEVPVSIGLVFPNLTYLNMSHNLLQGVIPSSIKHLKLLKYLALSNNNISGQISDFVEELHDLYVLDLSVNQFHGHLLPNNWNPLGISVFVFVVNNNQLTGEIPTNLCNLSSLSYLDISENHFSGNLPSCITNMFLSVLSVEGNNLEGNLPTELCYTNGLALLDLSKNNFFGQVPSCFNLLTQLEYLNLRGNKLTGPFPNAFSNMSQLATLDLGNNHFVGHIPSWIGTKLHLLKIFSLKGNHFDGPISEQICNLRFLRILDLSHNNLSGHIPSCLHNIGHDPGLDFQFSIMIDLLSPQVSKAPHQEYITYEVKPADSTLTISEYIEFHMKKRSDNYRGDILHYLSGLDLSCNQLIGMIPENIGQMTWLRVLNFSNNLLIGPIPVMLSNLKNIESLDLSHNMLVGRIPPQLAELHFLAVFSVAYNNLSGPTIGFVAQFSTFDESSYEGNLYLCGPPLVKNCSSMITSPKDQVTNDIHPDKKAAKDRLILFASIALGFIIGFWGWMALLFLNRNLRYSYFLAIDGYMEEAFYMTGNLLPKMKSCL
ncbi:Non-specific serine/threonine protein kinase protein [Dioscorea alata]|uniref:Non-specific serine/threonine protein kinase protein n=1 Tax=Dioscorea alata TaxID=55571 RepID=A0ACB7WKK4_DIOAL|nr:Non-specific serine/threonine protein kinase protein [Dioscorea alata]